MLRSSNYGRPSACLRSHKNETADHHDHCNNTGFLSRFVPKIDARHLLESNMILHVASKPSVISKTETQQPRSCMQDSRLPWNAVPCC